MKTIITLCALVAFLFTACAETNLLIFIKVPDSTYLLLAAESRTNKNALTAEQKLAAACTNYMFNVKSSDAVKAARDEFPTLKPTSAKSDAPVKADAPPKFVAPAKLKR